MTHFVVSFDPQDFGLASFADILPNRGTIPGEAVGGFEMFRDHMMASLIPFTPYEAVIAEILVSIEWELLQHRRMRERSLQTLLVEAIEKAIVSVLDDKHEETLDLEFDDWCAARKDPDAFVSRRFNKEAAEMEAAELAQRAVDLDPVTARSAQETIEGMGIVLLDLMGEAYRSRSQCLMHHENMMSALEGRRRKVKADFDALQKSRPIEADVVAG